MPIAEFHSVRPDLFVWQAYEPAVKCDLTACARVLDGGLIFIDPIPLADDALAGLADRAAPIAIVLTNGNHGRAAAEVRSRFSIPILAHTAAVPELALEVDQELADGDLALGRFEVVEIAGAAAGEIALIAGDAAHVGDALIHLPPFGFAPLPDKYCGDPREMRRALGKLLRFNFEVLTFAHGLPLVSQARQRLENLLA